MKKDEIPQDLGALGRITKEVCYAVDENGNYTTALSDGWEVKNMALDMTWNEIRKSTDDARQKVLDGEASPILYFMALRIMDLPTVAAYSGFWQWQVKRHLKPGNFARLSEKKLQRYASAFDTTIEGLKNMTANEG